MAATSEQLHDKAYLVFLQQRLHGAHDATTASDSASRRDCRRGSSASRSGSSSADGS